MDTHPKVVRAIQIVMLSLAAGLLAILAFPIVLTLASSKRGAMYERRIFGGAPVEVRVSAYHEDVQGFALPGAFMVFEARPCGSEAWSLLLEYAHDDPRPIPNVVLDSLDANISWFCSEYRYAVTTDGGRSWHPWHLWRDLPDVRLERNPRYGRIADVVLAESGRGFMRLEALPDEEPQGFWTEDFGRTWKR